MPKDAWRSARQRKRFGAVAAPRAPKPRRRKPRRTPTAAYSPETVLWFGKHKGTRLGDAPLDYLNWLCSQPPGPSGQINALVEWLVKDA